MLSVSIVIGILAGCGNIFFRYLIGLFQKLFYGSSDEKILFVLTQKPVYKILLIPAIWGLIVGLITILFTTAKGHGVPDVVKAVILNKEISPVVALIKSVLSAITIGS
jgi:CIC family chloride channel protein